tara:strand:+ start:701 stop:808 length:108 start_codon:yes stop_codon:yes gene_type:complete
MEKINYFWKGLSKRGKILFVGLGGILALIILGAIF